MFSNTLPTLEREVLTSKKAVELLLDGSLRKKVCRFCLCVTQSLVELDRIFQIHNNGALYSVSIRNMLASFHPLQIADDLNMPSKICQICINKTLTSYLFTQQCEQAGRALMNCFDDITTKFDKLDPIDRPKNKRGRQKLHPNYNILNLEHKNVIDYAQPVITLVNLGSKLVRYENTDIFKNECMKCWQILPNTEAFLNHQTIHPKSMWFNCRLCGQGFVRANQLKNHMLTHAYDKPKALDINDFKCKECGNVSHSHKEHLQHVERHKFKKVLNYFIHKKMDDLCAVCLERRHRMTSLDEVVNLSGGHPDLSGNRSLYNIVGNTIPEMSLPHNYTGTKICDKCQYSAISAYVFTHYTNYNRNRLKTCISLMLDNLPDKDPVANVFIEISREVVLPIAEECINDKNNDLAEILEDEFRTQSESESDANDVDTKTNVNQNNIDIYDNDRDVKSIPNQAKFSTKTYQKRPTVNGYQTNEHSVADVNKFDDVCSEFLTFNKKKTPENVPSCRFTCPICSKYFITDFHFRRHVVKHVSKKTSCSVCKRVFPSIFFMHEHRKVCKFQNNTDHATCSTCGRTFTDKARLVNHLKSHRMKECHLCNKTFVCQSNFDSHMQRHATKFNIHKSKNMRNCSFCEKECSNDSRLSLHVNRSHLQIKPYTCDMCDSQFYAEANLRKHKKVHNLITKEVCEFCNATLNSRKALVVHIREHINVKPHVCLVCKESFYSESKLKKHMIRVHGGKYYCRFCKVMLLNKSHLKRHNNVVHNVI